MKPATSKTIDVTPDANGRYIASTPDNNPDASLIPFEEEAPLGEPSWERARELWHQATHGAEALIELSFVLCKLKQEFFNQGGCGKFGSNARSEKGWEKTVEEKLGINQQRARRLIEKGDVLFRLKTITDGHEVEWQDARGQHRKTEPTQEKAQLAEKLIPDVVAGLVSARRAWAGVCGEGSRSEISKQRAPVDHAAAMLRAIKSLSAGFRIYHDLPANDQAAIIQAWDALADVAPDNMISIFRKKGSKK